MGASGRVGRVCRLGTRVQSCDVLVESESEDGVDTLGSRGGVSTLGGVPVWGGGGRVVEAAEWRILRSVVIAAS